jgi:hypothetical protein
VTKQIFEMRYSLVGVKVKVDPSANQLETEPCDGIGAVFEKCLWIREFHERFYKHRKVVD